MWLDLTHFIVISMKDNNWSNRYYDWMLLTLVLKTYFLHNVQAYLKLQVYDWKMNDFLLTIWHSFQEIKHDSVVFTCQCIIYYCSLTKI